MANRVNVDLDMNVQGYVDGMDKATQSTAAYETETKKVKDEQLNLNKELRKAKTDARNLAATYALLDKQAKQSQFGREIAKQLEEAKQKAAELIDINSDLQEELKNRASDTATFDAFVDGVSGLTSGLSAATGVLGIFTKNTETMTRAITLFTTAESIASAAIKAKNLLQKQSSLMLAINNIQQKALTAATVEGTAATQGATIAQRAFNLVAKANPYVLLFTGLTAVIGAIGTYVLLTNKAESATEKFKKEMHETSLQAQKDAQKDITELNLLYNATQNTKLAIDERRRAAEQLQDMYPAYFGNLKTEEILVGKASDAYKQLKDDIIAVAMARAYQDKITEKAKENVDLEDQLEKAEKELEKKRKQRNSNQGGFTPGAYSPAATAGELWDLQGAQNDIDELKNKIKENNDAMSSYQDKINETSDAQRRLSKENEVVAGSISDITNQINKLKNKFSNGLISKEDYNKQKAELDKQLKLAKAGTDLADKGGGKKDVKIEIAAESLAAYEKELADLQERAKKGALPDDLKDPKKLEAKIQELKDKIKEKKIELGIELPDTIESLEKRIVELQTLAKKGALPDDLKDPKKFIAEINRLQAEVKEKKIEFGFEKPDTQLQKLQKTITDAQQKYIIAVDADDKSAQQAALEEYYAAQKTLDEYKLKITIEPRISDEEVKKQRNEISKIVQEAYKPEDQKFDFSGLSESAQKEANATLTQFNKIKEARDKLVEIMNNPNSSDTQISAAQDGIDSLSDSYNTLESIVGKYQEMSDAAIKVAENNKKISESVNSIGNAVQAAGEMFSALGKLTQDKGLQTTGLIAEAVATVALSFARALTTAKTWVDWLAFGLSGAATMINLIAQIKSATAGAYAQGGIVGGSSFSGDRLTARVNSGEMILNQRQQKNLFNLLDNDAMPKAGGTNVQVTGVIHGTDLLLVQKNTNKILNKTGNKINF